MALRIPQSIDNDQPLKNQVEAWDESGIDHWWINDTDHFTIDGDGIIRNATVLSPDIYRLEIRAYDPYSDFCSVVLILTVNEVPMTSTSTTAIPLSTGTASSSSLVRPDGVGLVLTLLIGMEAGAAAVVIAAIVILKRKA